MTNPLMTTIRSIAPHTSIIDLQGDITSQAEAALMSAYNEANQNGVSNFVLNFEQLDYMNSSGIGLLVTLLIRVQRQKQHMLAYGLSEHYQQIFELTRLNEAIAIYDSEKAAIMAVATPA